MMNFIRNYF